MDPPASVPGVLEEAGASTGARDALGTGSEHQETMPGTQHRRTESQEFITHLQEKCRTRLSVGPVQTKIKALWFPERSVGR